MSGRRGRALRTSALRGALVRTSLQCHDSEQRLMRTGTEKEMRVTHSQPHLVEPMKLTVYDALPETPVTAQRPSQVPRLMHQARESISRASTRASFSAKRRTKSRPSISKPQAALAIEGCQLRRNPSFRPLQLSIYVDKRLSDLPEFDALSFSEEGEILRPPPRALIRTHSEELLRSFPTESETRAAKPASMFEQTLSRRVSHVRQRTDSTVISTSRPSSAYEALHSHPVSWYSLPGLPPTLQFASAPALAKKILSPMQEEFSSSPTGAVIIDGKVLAFPDVEADRVPSDMAHSSLLPPAPGQERDPAAPSPIIDPGPNRRTTVIQKHQAKISQSASILLASSVASTRTRTTTIEKTLPAAGEVSRPYFHTDFKTNNRINQWLGSESKEEAQGRSRESSISTIRTQSTSSSFAEHRRKRSQFYQLNQPKTADISPEENKLASIKSTKTPTPLNLYTPFPVQKIVNPAAKQDTHSRSKSSMSLRSHARTQTSSTVASTVATDVLFEQPETPELEREDVFSSAQALPTSGRRAYDAESMTTVDMKSRTGTMKSTMTSASHRQASPVLDVAAVPAYDNGAEIVSITKGSEHTEFVFRGNTPSPVTPSPRTPLSAKTKDIEKMMFEMCKQGGYRRVNVGVAF